MAETNSLAEIQTMDEHDLIRLRNKLEIMYEHEQVVGTDREREIRQQLRAIRHRLGTNRDPEKAFEWRIVCVLAPKVDVTWKDRKGKTLRFQCDLRNVDEWLSSIDREMRQFAQYVFEKSWGKIRIAYVVRASDVTVTRMKCSSARGHYLSPSVTRDLLKGTFRPKDAVSVFMWLPKKGEGEFPWSKLKASASTGTSSTNDAHLTVFYTSEERMQKPGGWAKERKGGMLHEFWHHARFVLKSKKAPIQFKGWRPSVNGDNDWNRIKQEIMDQGLVPSDNRYDEFFPSWFTWKMIRKLKAHYGTRKGWIAPAVHMEEKPTQPTEPGWQTVQSWNVKEGSPEARTRLRTEPFTFAGRWRVRYGTRPARTKDGHFRIRVYRQDEKNPFRQIADVTDSSKITRNRDGVMIDEPGTFVLEVDADTEWWWLHVDEWR